ncbi:MAG TPA: sigma 54-interacting transcriptional regulator [Myxococcota bacterium]|nr:sigma 54-interacting transcriptional regulator [Myxococcota bacterium]
MSTGTQAKLLRALESRTFKRVGGVSPIRLDAGVIAATNRDLAAEVEAGRFREDLYFRLNVIRITIPSLRERREDIPRLVDHFLERFNRSFRRDVKGLSAAALDRMQSYPWPGNVRELRNVIERMVILEPHEIIEVDHLPPEVRYGWRHQGTATGAPFLLPESGVDLDAVERSLIEQAMDRTNGNQSAAARLLGITRYALRYRLEKYGLAMS